MTNYKHITRRASYNLARFMQTGNIDEKSRPEEVSYCTGQTKSGLLSAVRCTHYSR